MADFNKIFKTAEETQCPEEGEIIGQIPSWLNGTYLRVGPGKYDLDDEFTVNHVFDGYSMITKFNICGETSKVSLEKKYLNSEVYKKASFAKRPVICEFGTRGYHDPGKSLITRLIPTLIPELTDNCNMGLYQVGPNLFAGCETCHYHQIDPNSLNSIAKYDASKLFGTNTFTCHPLKDPDTGITYNFGASILTGSKYNLIAIPPPTTTTSSTTKDPFKKAKVICTFPSSWNGVFSFSHSFGMTKNYIVFIEQPYVLIVTRILAAVVKKGHCFQSWLEWRSDLRNNFWLIEKSTGKLIKIHYQSANPFFFLHIINCYEEFGHIIIDLHSYPSSENIESMTVKNMRIGKEFFNKNDLPAVHRYVLPIMSNHSEFVTNEQQQQHQNAGVNLISTIKTEATATLKLDPRNVNNSLIILEPEILIGTGLEFPRINSSVLGRKYKYFYATGSVLTSEFEHSIAKVNLWSKETISWKDNTPPSSDGDYFSYLGEPLFISRERKSKTNSNKENCDGNKCPIIINTSTGKSGSSSPSTGDEDDGIILCAATTGRPKPDTETELNNNSKCRISKDYLLCLDAKTFKELGRVNFNSHIPQGLHGIFLPS